MWVSNPVRHAKFPENTFRLCSLLSQSLQDEKVCTCLTEMQLEFCRDKNWSFYHPSFSTCKPSKIFTLCGILQKNCTSKTKHVINQIQRLFIIEGKETMRWFRQGKRYLFLVNVWWASVKSMRQRWRRGIPKDWSPRGEILDINSCKCVEVHGEAEWEKWRRPAEKVFKGHWEDRQKTSVPTWKITELFVKVQLFL